MLVKTFAPFKTASPVPALSSTYFLVANCPSVVGVVVPDLTGNDVKVLTSSIV